MLSAIRFIFYTELLLAFRRSQDWLYPIAFFVMVITLFPIAFSPDPIFMQTYLPGCVWIAALFANLLALNNLFVTEIEEDHLSQQLISSMPFTLLISIKIAAHWLATSFPLILLTALIGFILEIVGHSVGLLCLTLLLGTPVILLIGGLALSLTVGLKQQGILLGLILLPLILPILIFGINITKEYQAGMPILGPLAFLATLLILSIVLIPWVIGLAFKSY